MTFTTVLEHIADKIQKKEKYSTDLVESILDMEVVDLSKDLPIRERSQASDDDTKQLEQETFDKIYDEEVKKHVERKDRLKHLLPKAYSTIWQDHCSEAMQNEIKQLPNFKSEIRNDPIKLLKTIREHMHTTTRATYPIVGYVQAHMNLFTCKQQENESLIDFAKRLKNAGDVLKSLVGDNTMNYFSENTAEYKELTTAAEEATFKNKMFDRLIGYLAIANSDQAKYGQVTATKRERYAEGDRTYPADLETAVDILRNHKFDAAYYERIKKQKANQKESSDKKAAQLAQKKATVTCHACGHKGHYAPDCPYKDQIPTEKWYKNTNVVFAQTDADSKKSESSNNNSSRSETNQNDSTDNEENKTQATQSSKTWNQGPNNKTTRFGKQGFQLQVTRQRISAKQTKSLQDPNNYLKKFFMLDSGSSIPATIANPKMIGNLRPAEHNIVMQTNAGEKLLNVEGDVPGLPFPAYADPKGMGNILSLHHLAKHNELFRVVYDSDVSDSFFFHDKKKGGVIEFEANEDGLYLFEPSDEFLEEVERMGIGRRTIRSDRTSESDPYS
jgi:hypothetical protein